MNESLSSVGSSAHHGSVGKCNFDELAPVRSIAKRMDGHGDWHARNERLRLPALARQTTRPVHLDRPLLRPSVRINRQYDPRMRTRPLEFLDDALQGDLPFGIERREGMMCRRRKRGHGKSDERKDDYFDLHFRLYWTSLQP